MILNKRDENKGKRHHWDQRKTKSGFCPGREINERSERMMVFLFPHWVLPNHAVCISSRPTIAATLTDLPAAFTLTASAKRAVDGGPIIWRLYLGMLPQLPLGLVEDSVYLFCNESFVRPMRWWGPMGARQDNEKEMIKVPCFLFDLKWITECVSFLSLFFY